MGGIDREQEIGAKHSREIGQSGKQVSNGQGHDKPVSIGLQAASGEDKINYTQALPTTAKTTKNQPNNQNHMATRAIKTQECINK